MRRSGVAQNIKRYRLCDNFLSCVFYLEPQYRNNSKRPNSIRIFSMLRGEGGWRIKNEPIVRGPCTRVTCSSRTRLAHTARNRAREPPFRPGARSCYRNPFLRPSLEPRVTLPLTNVIFEPFAVGPSRRRRSVPESRPTNCVRRTRDSAVPAVGESDDGPNCRSP